MNDLQQYSGRQIQKQEEPKREVIVIRPQLGIHIEAPNLNQCVNDLAYAGADVAAKMTETTIFSPDGTVIQEKSMNVWLNQTDGISAEQARIRRLKGLQDLAARLGRK